MAELLETKSVQVVLVDGPVKERHLTAVGGAGAVVSFEGVVRPIEDGLPLLGLRYSSYDPMAERELRRIASSALSSHGLLAVRLAHSRGLVMAGEVSLLLHVAAEHRKPAIRGVDEIIDALKRDVPIWKTPVYEAAGS